ncbi:MAG: 2-oxoglutarate dehydrogenase, E2 component, dihydrolipoamide succinyltransferase, partial [Gaiellaceae bacterium]
MSDFVARVAARAVGAAPAAQPRVPAVFEPPAAASTLDVAEHEIAAAAPRARAPREAPAGPDPAPAPP